MENNFFGNNLGADIKVLADRLISIDNRLAQATGPVEFIENDHHGNIKINGYFSDSTPPTSGLPVGPMGPNTVVQLQAPPEPGLGFVFSSSPTQRIPYPDYENSSTYNYIYNDLSGSFYENKTLGQGHLWRVDIQIQKASGQTGAFRVRLYNTLSGFELSNVVYIPDGITDFEVVSTFYTIADGASLPSPLGTGIGYNFEIETFSGITLQDVNVKSLTRVSLPNNRLITILE